MGIKQPNRNIFDVANKKLIRLITEKISSLPLVVLALVCCCFLAQTAAAQQYQATNLASLGGTNSRGNSINNRSWVTGYSNLSPTIRHAALWLNNTTTPIDLGTLGAFERNRAVTWSVKNNNGLIVGISQTNTPIPLGENWSCSAFIAGTAYTCLRFAWEDGVMRPLNPLPGGNNSFATDANNRREIVDWAENGVRDPTCVANNQVLQFRPVVWDAKTLAISELPTPAGDSSGAATGINNKGQIVSIAGDCDQTIGRRTARHAVLWDKSAITILGNLGADYSNTPTDINQRGDAVGFAGTPGDPDGNVLRAFIWTKQDGIKPLGALPGHVHSEAYGINERRQVVGISCDADGVDCRAFLWENGVMKDLNNLIAPGFPARLEQAKDINERGEITGRAVNSANVRTAFLAVPIHGNAAGKKSVLSETQAKIFLPEDLKQMFLERMSIANLFR